MMRHKIETEKSSADKKLAEEQARLTEQREAARLKAEAKLAEEQRKLAELLDYNKPENVQLRQEIAAAEATRVEAASKAEAARVEAEAKAARLVEAAHRRVEAAKAKAEAARVKAADEAERPRALEGRSAFPPDPALRPASAPISLQMNCHPEHSAPYLVTYNGNVGTVLVTGSETRENSPLSGARDSR